MRISQLNHHNQQLACQIWQLFQSAYKIEAQILGLQNFPPLNRSVRQIREAPTSFFGGWQESALVAAAEVESVSVSHFHINGFGVSPDHFRKGYGSQLLTGLLDALVWKKITVSTAVANTPALHLYQKYGFLPQEKWTTPDNFQMITLLLKEIDS
jgi:ribosomal protein S18 acetylase RimI-like enzyme